MERKFRSGNQRSGLTLAEITVVLAILGILAMIVVPEGSAWSRRAREATLKQQLAAVRDTLDKFYIDQKRYPDRLEELVEKGYLRMVPADPFTGTNTSWDTVAPEDHPEQVFDLHSGSEERSMNGEPVSEW